MNKPIRLRHVLPSELFVLASSIDKGMIEQDNMPTTSATIYYLIMNNYDECGKGLCSDLKKGGAGDYSLFSPDTLVYRINIIALSFEFKGIELDPSIGRIIPAPKDQPNANANQS